MGNHAATCLFSFVKERVEFGSLICTGGIEERSWLEANGYRHEITKVGYISPSGIPTMIDTVTKPLKLWLEGTHSGAASPEHLDYYLDEFAFRFVRRKCRFRGELFYHLLQQAVALEPTSYKDLVGGTSKHPHPHQHYGLTRVK